MHDDELMDQLLKDAMASEAPQLSKEFDANVMRAVRPSHLTQTGRIVMAVYSLAAAATAVWLMGGLPIELIAIGAVACIATAASVSSYAKMFAH